MVEEETAGWYGDCSKLKAQIWVTLYQGFEHPFSARHGEKKEAIMTKESGALRRMSAELTIDRASLLGPFHDWSHSDWKAIKGVMSHLGYELKFIHVVFAGGDGVQLSEKIIPFRVPTIARAA